MARPDLSAERTEQILDAFSRCVARSGLDAVSLEEVAGEAGVRRSIIRHYIGNRDDLVAAFLDRLEARLQRQNDDMRAWFIAGEDVARLPDYLFPEAPDDELPVLESVYSAARRNPDIAGRLETWFQGFVEALGDVLRASFPEEDPGDITTVAYGLAAIYNDHQSMLTLQGPSRYRAMALAATRRLVASLTTRP